jgi:2-methylcitrate dehydratase PrpD
VTVGTTDGRQHTARVHYHLGHAQRPVGNADIEAKFCGLARGLLTDEQQDAALHALWRVDEAQDLGAVMELLAARDAG